MVMKKKKLWTSISAATLAGVASLSACSPEEKATDEMAMEAKAHEAAESVAPEGEGEGEGSGATDLAHDDLAYLTKLGLMRGHLYVGNELYLAGHIDHAKTHSKHPGSELYADVVPAFAARGSEGFAAELSAYAEAFKQEASSGEVEQAYTALVDAIAKNESAVSDRAKTNAEKLKLASVLVRAAGDEYKIAVVDQTLESAHEYQDALGFTMVARGVVESIQGDIAQKTDALAILNDLKALWPSLIPPQTLSTEAGQLYGAAAKIELLSLSIGA
jgi:hypothetical protein